MSNQPFKKFIEKKNNAAVKEKHKQDKKLAKKQRAGAIEKRYEEKRAANNKGQEPAKKTYNKPLQPSKNAVKEKSNLPVMANPAVGKINEMPLNKYLAHCGIASRRNAISFITNGKVSVNKTIIKEPGFKVTGSEEILFSGERIFVTKNLVYILLNKPKDYITTSDDPQNRKTVLQLVQRATDQRIYAVGRLDRNTSGVLLLTNDGDLTQKLTHPKFEVKKVYEVQLDKPLTKTDFEKILAGLKLEDGEIKVDAIAHPEPNNKSIVGLEIHSGRNRIVRRIFESLGYDVRGLDRVMYADLTKKNVQRGKWRFLAETEVRALKHMLRGKK